MPNRACSQCGGEIEPRFRFCPWCATPQRVKLVEFFRPHPLIEEDRGRALRASWYLGRPRHVRFSVWEEREGQATATAAMSLDEPEAERLTHFLAGPLRRPSPQSGLRAIVRELRTTYFPSGR